jgi:hypothetical protein
MKMYEVMKFTAPPLLTSALDGGEWSDSRHCCFTPGERYAGTLWIGGWVGSRAGLDDMDTVILSTFDSFIITREH